MQISYVRAVVVAEADFKYGFRVEHRVSTIDIGDWFVTVTCWTPFQFSSHPWRGAPEVMTGLKKLGGVARSKVPPFGYVVLLAKVCGMFRAPPLWRVTDDVSGHQ